MAVRLVTSARLGTAAFYAIPIPGIPGVPMEALIDDCSIRIRRALRLRVLP